MLVKRKIVLESSLRPSQFWGRQKWGTRKHIFLINTFVSCISGLQVGDC